MWLGVAELPNSLQLFGARDLYKLVSWDLCFLVS